MEPLEYLKHLLLVDAPFSYIYMSWNMRLKLSACVKEASVKHVMRFSKRMKKRSVVVCSSGFASLHTKACAVVSKADVYSMAHLLSHSSASAVSPMAVVFRGVFYIDNVIRGD